MKNFNKYILLLAVIVGFSFFTINANSASAQEKTVTVSQIYTFGAGKGCSVPGKAQKRATITTGNVSVLHKVNPNSATTVQVGNSWTFTYNPDNPVYHAYGGNFDTPIGSFCSGIDDQCFGNIEVGSLIDGGGGGAYAYVYWTAVKPTVNLWSSNSSVISCPIGGKTCSAISEGSATITADIANTKARIWAKAYNADQRLVYDDSVFPAGQSDWWASGNPNSMLIPLAETSLPAGYCFGAAGYFWGPYLGKSSMDLPVQALSWDFTVTAAFDFSLAKPADISVVQGKSITNPITANRVNGTAQSVTFSASAPGLPANSILFTPKNCPPTCASNLTIYTDATTPLGQSTITVTGTAGALTRSTSFVLTVTAPPTPSIDLKVNGGDYKPVANALKKISGETVNFTWNSANVSTCWASGDDSNWKKSSVTPTGSSNNYTLPTVTSQKDYEYKISCSELITQNGFWNKILAFFGFAKNVFAQVGDVEDSVFIRVNPAPIPLSVVVSVAPNPVQVNNNATWLATPSGGTGPYSYSWSGADLSGGGASKVKSYATPGSRTGTVIVTDSTGATRSDSESLVVQAASNSAPVANAGAPHSIIEDISHTHSGATATDVDGNLQNYSWTFVSCPSSCPSLFNRTGSISGFSDTVGGPRYTPTIPGNYMLQLTVTDLNGATDTDTVTENVTPTPPTASINANPNPITNSGDPTDLTWSCVNSTKAEIYENNVLNVALSNYSCGGSCSGTFTRNPIVRTEYKVRCTNVSPFTEASVTVQILFICEGPSCPTP
ncbi:MAG: hypothetical protein Q8L47_04335 [bacterium]|nr:hypothetical protein [bacterium]